MAPTSPPPAKKSAVELTDEYVANLLREEARQALQRKDSLGNPALGQHLPGSRPPNDAPRTNTRFLRNLLRDTAQHNAALLENERRAIRDRAYRDRDDGRRDRRRRSASPRRDHDHGDQRSRKRRTYEQEHDDRHHRHRERTRRERRSSRSRSRSRDRNRRAHKRRRHSPESPPRDQERRNRRRSPEKAGNRQSSQYGRLSRYSPTTRVSSSDPLEAIVGPLPAPPTEVRGRGKAGGAAAMDEHFKADYDPAADTAGDDDDVVGDDWEQKREMYRDSKKWALHQAQRHKAAGWTDEELKKWCDGAKRDEASVRWAAKGEGREWDRGKVVDGDFIGNVPSWRRRLS